MNKDTKEVETKKEAPGKIVEIHEGEIKAHVDQVVRESVEETLNVMLDEESKRLCRAGRYERTEARVDTRAGHYTRKLETRVGEIQLQIPKLRHVPFETAIIERYRRRESSVEEALVEMYLAGVSVRRVEDITEALWGTRVSPATISALNKKVYARLDEWRNRPIEGRYAYVFLDGMWLKRSWGGEVRTLAILVAVGVDKEGFREVLGVMEGAKEDYASWLAFLRHLKARGLKGVRLIISDKCLGLVEALGEVFPEALWQRCTVHFYRNVFTAVPRGKVREVAAMLKAIHAQEDRKAALEKAAAVTAKLEAMELGKAASIVREGAHETLSYYDFPPEHWSHLRTNNPLERIIKEIRRRTRVVGSFPDGQSALMLAAARLRHIAGTKWGTRRYMNMEHLQEIREEVVTTA
jgi:transposase-like protein